MRARAASKRSHPSGLASRAAKKLKTTHPLVYRDRPKEVLDVFVCGEGESGELGLGARKRDGKQPVGVKSPRLNDLASAFGVVQIAAGGMHCAALTRDSLIVTWGVNDDGALGRSTQDSTENGQDGRGNDGSSDLDSEDDDLGLNRLETTPTAVSPDLFGSDASFLVQVATSDCATFVLTAYGTVYGWGTFKSKNGTFGFSEKELAKGIMIQKTPLLIPGLRKIKSIAAGINHVLALDASGRVFSWGMNESGELGQKPYSLRRRTTSSSILTPAAVFLPGIKVVSIFCGHSHSFAIDDKGHVYGWGLNNERQLSIRPGTDNPNVVTLPTRVTALESFGVEQVAGGFHHSIACCTDGQVLVWGRCHDSQMGLPLKSVPPDLLLYDSKGRPENLTVPTIVPGVSASYVTAGIDNSVAISANGQAYAWGYSQSYRTGLRTEESVQAPTLITNSAIKTRKITFAACGGQFLILVGQAPAINGVK